MSLYPQNLVCMPAMKNVKGLLYIVFFFFLGKTRGVQRFTGPVIENNLCGGSQLTLDTFPGVFFFGLI